MNGGFPCLGCRIVTNSCTCVSLIHFTKLLNKKIEGSLKGLFVVFWARFPYNPILYYAHSSLLKENNSANNRLPLGLSVIPLFKVIKAMFLLPNLYHVFILN